MSTQINKSEFHEIYNKTYNSILKFIAVKCQNVEDINDILQDTYTELYKILNKRTIIEVESEVAFIIGIAKKILKRYFSFKYKYQLLSYSLNTDELDDDGQAKLVKSDDYFSEGYGTPLLLVVKDDEIVDIQEGLTDKDATVNFLKDNGFIEE